jgi:hypothetical protein
MRRLAWLIWIALGTSALPAGRLLAQAPAPAASPDGADYYRRLATELERQLRAERQLREALERELDRLRRAAPPAPRPQTAERPPQADEARRQEDEARRQEIERRHAAEYEAWQAEVRAAQERIREEALRREAEGKGQRPPRPGRSGAAAPPPGEPAAARQRPAPHGLPEGGGLALSARRPEEVCAAGSVLGPSAGAWKDDSTGRGSYVCFTPYV